MQFVDRHIGPRETDIQAMTHALGYQSLSELIDAAVPESIRISHQLNLPDPVSESEVLDLLRERAQANTVRKSMIGQGYYGTTLPPVISRNVLENPGWYTAYTPYQPEISQGRLEALLNFQTMVSELTALPIANASLLDEATAAAEAASLMSRATKAKDDAVLLVDQDIFPQTLAVIQTRASAVGYGVEVRPLAGKSASELAAIWPEQSVFGVIIQQPGAHGHLHDIATLVDVSHERGAMVTVVADILSLTLLTPPGHVGADVAVGSTQRFGVAMGFGGPHAAYMSVRDGLERMLPGRLVGVSKDVAGQPAYRLALQTREQHIRREKATSNICTSQVLLANLAGMYAVYHGPEGLREIARHVHHRAATLWQLLQQSPHEVSAGPFFDTLQIRTSTSASDLVAQAAQAGYWLKATGAHEIVLSTDELTTAQDVTAIAKLFGVEPEESPTELTSLLPPEMLRTDSYMQQPVFSAYRSETEMLRYLRKLQDADYALDRGMIPLGSCTMKLNATAEMIPITWPEFANLHPFAPDVDTVGSRQLIDELSQWLAEITGFAEVHLQPNAGSQGEFAGLLAIRRYHDSRGDHARRVCLIPASAHGTNAASAALAGLRVVVVACDAAGNVDMADLAKKIETHADQLAALMITYPSTHGVFEDTITQVCKQVHAAGGQVYIDGANLNALVGLAQPGQFGGDVAHLNLHKTFCIPHGGGGPGVGPVAVGEHLREFLPGAHGPEDHPVSAAEHGSAGILPITWAYIHLMGAAGLRRATEVAVLAANYLAKELAADYPVLYTGPGGLVAHECIIDLRPLTKETGISIDDVVKRLIDFGFHPPTMSFPVPGTLMIEPTESESKAELDRFVQAMRQIKKEIDAVAAGVPVEDSVLRQAPHTAEMLTHDWEHPYSRQEAVFPAGVDPRDKYWPPVRRIDGAWGDRNLMCSCGPVSDWEDLELTTPEGSKT